METISDSDVQAKIVSALKTLTPNSAIWLHFRTYDDWLNGQFNKQLVQRVRKSNDLKNTSLVLCPQFRGSDEPEVPGLGALGNALFYLDPNHKLKGIRLQWSRFRNTTFRRQAAYLSKTFLPMTALGFIGIVSAIVTGFHGNYGVYAFIAFLAIVTVPLGNMLTSDGLAQPAATVPDGTQLSALRDPVWIARLLERICGSASCLLIVIDDITLLKRVERSFLDLLIAKKPIEEIAALRAKTGLLLVTLDPTRMVQVPKARSYELPEPSDSFIEVISKLVTEQDVFLEAKARALIGMLGAGKQGRWGALDLLAICAADLFQTRSDKSWASILDSNNSILSLHVQEMGLSIETDPMNLLRQLADSDLYAAYDRSYRRNRDLARSINKILQREHQLLVLAANLFWYRFYSDPNRGDHLEDLAHSFALGAARCLEPSVSSVPLDLLGALTRAARYWRETGETELSVEALLLGRGLIKSAHEEIPLSFLDDLSAEWLALYLLSGSPSSGYDGEGEEAEDRPNVLQRSQPWRVQLSQVETLRHGGNVDAIDDAQLSTEVQNHIRCMMATAKVRELGGSASFEKADFVIAEPAQSPHADVNEFMLMSLWAKKADSQNDIDAFVSQMEKFRNRLSDLAPDGSLLGLRAVWLYGRARYSYRLLSFWKEAANHPDPSAKQDSKKHTAAQIVTPLLLEPVDLIDRDLPYQIRRLLEQALELSNLLLYRGLSILSVEMIAQLLSEYTALFSEQDPLWWQNWDQVLEATLDECSRLGWSTSEVVIRYHRAAFFQSLDIRSSAWDKLLFYKAAVCANYAVDSLLSWNDDVTRSLTGPQLSQRAYLELAHVYEERAALLERSREPIAMGREIEEISSFVFAAQSYIFADEIASARKALEAALPKVIQRFGELDCVAPDEPIERSILFSFLYVCALMPEAVDSSLPRLDARRLWQLLREEDANLPTALASLVKVETQGNGWFQETELSILDPFNPHLRLRQGEGVERHACPKTLYEFWVRLLVGWLAGDSWADPSAIALQRERWSHFSKIEDAVVALAIAGRPLDGIPELDRLIAALLEETYHNASQVFPDDNVERSVLELLMNSYRPGQREWHDRYLEVCQEFAELLNRESQQLAESRQPNLIDLIIRIDTYLRPLQDRTLLRNYLETDGDRQMPAIRQMEVTLKTAEDLLLRRDYLNCWLMLHPLMDIAGSVPVTLLKLKVLDTARRVVMECGSLKTELPGVSAAMRSTLSEYGNALASTIRKQEDREVATRIANHILHIFSLELI